MHVVLERGQRAIQVVVVLLTLVLLPHDVQTGHVLLMYPLAVEEKGRRLMDVEDDTLRELFAGSLDEIKPRETVDRVVRPHERRRDERLDALRREPFARAGVDGVDVREEEVPPGHDAGVEFDEVLEVARLLPADLGLDALRAPLVRIGAHGRLARFPESVDVTAVRSHAAPDQLEHEVGGVLVGCGLDNALHNRAEKRTVGAQGLIVGHFGIVHQVSILSTFVCVRLS